MAMINGIHPSRHYNAPKFYSQLQDATPEKFQKVASLGVFLE